MVLKHNWAIQNYLRYRLGSMISIFSNLVNSPILRLLISLRRGFKTSNSRQWRCKWTQHPMLGCSCVTWHKRGFRYFILKFHRTRRITALQWNWPWKAPFFLLNSEEVVLNLIPKLAYSTDHYCTMGTCLGKVPLLCGIRLMQSHLILVCLAYNENRSLKITYFPPLPAPHGSFTYY